MFKTKTSITVTASDRNGKELKVKFKILDTDIADKWINIIEQNQELQHTLQANYRKILSPEERLENFSFILYGLY